MVSKKRDAGCRMGEIGVLVYWYISVLGYFEAKRRSRLGGRGYEIRSTEIHTGLPLLPIP